MSALNTRYFEEFLPQVIGREVVTGLQSLNTCFEVSIRDWPEGTWRLVVEGGRLGAIAHEGPEPVVRFEMDGGLFETLIAAERSPVEAFLAQEIVIEGDMEQGLTVGTILEEFFRLYPFAP